MEIQGKVIAALDVKSGVSQRNGSEWKAQDFVIETHESYPHKMVFSVFGADRLARFNIQIGQEITVLFDIDAHEYQGRWFNSIRAYDVRQVDPSSIGVMGAQPVQAPPFASAPEASPIQNAQPIQPVGQSPVAGGENADDLPF